MKRRDWSGPIIYLIAAVLLVLSCAGCALFQPCPVDAPAARMSHHYRHARADGKIDDSEMAVLDEDCNDTDDALDEKAASFTAPSTGNPLLDGGIALGIALLTGGATHRYTMRKRDKTRAKALEEVKEGAA